MSRTTGKNLFVMRETGNRFRIIDASAISDVLGEKHSSFFPRFHAFSDAWILKCHCNEKILDPISNTTEQHFHTSFNGVFSFSISCFVLEILSFFETCKLGVSDVIYSRIINYIYQMVNISVNSRQKFFKLYMTIGIL